MSKVQKLLEKADKLMGDNLSVISKENLKKTIKSFGRHKNNPFFWNNGVLAYALHKYRFDGKNLQKVMKRKAKISEIDDTLFFYVNFDYYDVDAHRKIYNFAKKYPTSRSGSIAYRSNKPYIFIDSLGMLCPYLAKFYDCIEKDATILDTIFTQFFNFFSHGFDTNSGLPYHGFDFDEEKKLGIIGWGRAIGWLLFGIAECLSYMPENDERLDALRLKTQNLIQTISKYARNDGGFSWQLQAMDGFADVSATAMIGYSISKMNREGFLDNTFSELLDHMEMFLLDNITDNGDVINSSAECQGFSMYPQRYENNSWGQAFTIMFFAERGYDLG